MGNLKIALREEDLLGRWLTCVRKWLIKVNPKFNSELSMFGAPSKAQDVPNTGPAGIASSLLNANKIELEILNLAPQIL